MMSNTANIVSLLICQVTYGTSELNKAFESKMSEMYIGLYRS